MPSPVLIIDAANVVGSVPDGWWRDRAGSTAKLRDHAARLGTRGIESERVPAALRQPPLDVVLVVEGAAKRVSGCEGVELIAAPGSGDDTIVDVVAARIGDAPCFVATADRELGERVRRLGAVVIGPRSVRHGR